MLPEIYIRSQRLSNNSDTYISGWKDLDFDMCEGKGLEEGRYVWAFCTLVCFTFGFPASIAILLEMFKIRKRGTPITPNDFFILNLSIMDAVFLVFIPPGLLNYFIMKRGDFEAFWTGIYAFNQTGRPLLMACICLDCYFAVVHPIAYHKRKSLTPRIAMAGIVWTLTAASGILYFFSFKSYFSIIPYVPFIISIVIIGICDSFILHALIKSFPGRANIHPQKQRSIQILINSLVMTVISYFPPVILFVVGNSMTTSFKIFTCKIGILITITSTLGSSVMPILYLNNIGKLDRFRFACCRKS